MLNGASSVWSDVRSGVPQGSVLGPILFLLYINDINKNISSNIRLFADDCISYRLIKNQTDVSILQNDLDKLMAWSKIWQMNFNISKCCVMQLSYKRNKILNKYSMNNIQLQHTT